MNKVILILIAVMVFTGALSIPADNTQIQQYPTEEPTATIIPTPRTTHAPGPTPVPGSNEQKNEYVLLENVPIGQSFETATFYQDDWAYSEDSYPFLVDDTTFESCIGMYIPAKTIENEWGQDEVSYLLNGKYEKIQFDIFTDTKRTTGIYEDYGLYKVLIYADGNLIYDSDSMYYDSVVNDKIIILPENTLMMSIHLIEKRGRLGTLDIVLGDFYLYLWVD